MSLTHPPPISNLAILKRDWSKYCVNDINATVLRELDLMKTLNWSSLNVCEYWNTLECVLIRSIDAIAPLKAFKVNLKPKSNDLPTPIKQKINKRKRLLKLDKKNN